MGCGCGGKTKILPQSSTLGYRLIRPDGVKTPPDGQPPFLTVLEARAEQRAFGGGTIVSVPTRK